MQTPDSLVVVVNPLRPSPGELIEKLKAWCQERDWGFLLVDGERVGAMPGRAPLGVSLGGDGTMLRSVRLLTPCSVPLLGVNLGSLGFLSPLKSDQLWRTLEDVAAGRCELEARMQLETVLNGNTHIALNEFSITHEKGAAFTEVELHRGEEFIASYPGDGVIVSTPTGSTAYSLAAGGPVMSPELRLILVTPLNPHKLGLRPLVLSPSCVLTVRVLGTALLRGDGKTVAELPQGTRFDIRVSNSETRLVKLPGSPDWFTLLEQKLHWQRHSQRKPLGG